MTSLAVNQYSLATNHFKCLALNTGMGRRRADGAYGCLNVSQWLPSAGTSQGHQVTFGTVASAESELVAGHIPAEPGIPVS